MSVRPGGMEAAREKLLALPGEVWHGVTATVRAPVIYTGEVWDGAVSLSQLVGQAVPYEARPAPLDERIRRGALVGVGLIAAYLLMTWAAMGNLNASSQRADFFVVGWSVFRGVALFGGYPAVGVGLALGTLVGAAALAIRTEGFRSGPLWAHFATCGLAFAGLVAAIPVLMVLAIIALNLAIWIVIIVATLALIWGILFALLDSL